MDGLLAACPRSRYFPDRDEGGYWQPSVPAVTPTGQSASYGYGSLMSKPVDGRKAESPPAVERCVASGLRRFWMLRIVATALVALLATACGRTPDEQALRDSIAKMQQALEERSLSGVMDRVTDDFGGSHGMDRDGLRRLLQGQILANTRIGATLGPITVEQQGERASVRFSAILTGGGRFLPERGRAYSVHSGWRVEGGEWKVYFAEWEGEAQR